MQTPEASSQLDLAAIGELIAGLASASEVIKRTDRLVEDLRLDSLALLELAAAIQEICGRNLPEDLIASWRTVGDVYGWLAELSQGATGPPTPPPSRPRQPLRPFGVSPEPPPMLTRHITLRPLMPADVGPLYALSADPAVAWRWRQRGTTPSPDLFAASLWNDTLTQFCIESRETGQLVGLVSGYHADMRNGWCYVAALIDASLWGAAWPLEGALCFIDYLFRVFNMRKLYFESIEFNADAFASAAGRYLVEEGRLSGHEFHDGQWWDLLIYALHRQTWQETDMRSLLGN